MTKEKNFGEKKIDRPKDNTRSRNGEQTERTKWARKQEREENEGRQGEEGW